MRIKKEEHQQIRAASQPKREASLAAPNGYAVRAMNPRQGDKITQDSTTIEVIWVADGIVDYVVQNKTEKLDRQAPLEDWPRLMRIALDKGATFHAA